MADKFEVQQGTVQYITRRSVGDLKCVVLSLVYRLDILLFSVFDSTVVSFLTEQHLLVSR